MALPSSFADVYTDVQKLLLAAGANSEAIPELASAKLDLEQVFGQLQELSVRRDRINADKQALSQQLKAVKKLAREKSSELRNFVRFKLGMRNEKLVEFKIAPARLGKPRPRTGESEAARKQRAKLATPEPQLANTPATATD